MDRIREQFRNPIAAAIAGGVLGLILGLIIGWGIWPVQWTDASPGHLREDYQTQYLCGTIDAYIRHGNPVDAQARFLALGEEGPRLLAELRPGTCNLNEGEITQFQAVVLGSTLPLPETTSAVPGQATALPGEAEEGGGLGRQVTLLVGLCLVLLLVGAGIAYLMVFRNRRPAGPAAEAAPRERGFEPPRQPVRAQYVPETSDVPIVQFMTTYTAGEEGYDDSFSIDSPTGEFLGECGVGVADTIGVGEPKKVTAFEVWLFDKNDIQTVTKVLMSEHAFNDPQVRQRLASKGEPVLITPDKSVVLETAALQLEARVVDLSYGQGALPDRSFFDRLTLELAVWPK